MPIYDYTCSACARTTEVVHGIHDAAPRFCPACGAEGTLRKAFATPAVHFKGSGWAKKDRGSSATTKAAARSSSASSGGTDTSGAGPAASPAPGGSGGETAGGSTGGSGASGGGD